MGFWDHYKITVGERRKTAFVNEIGVYPNGAPFGNHYGAVIPKGAHLSPFECGNEFYICLNHNGTDVVAWEAKLEKIQPK